MDGHCGETTGERISRERAEQQRGCPHERTHVEDLTIDRMCGNVVCTDCGKFLRTYDAG